MKTHENENVKKWKFEKIKFWKKNKNLAKMKIKKNKSVKKWKFQKIKKILRKIKIWKKNNFDKIVDKSKSKTKLPNIFFSKKNENFRIK